MKALVVVAVMASTAYAETPETAEQLTEAARDLARAGHCKGLPALGKRVHELDDDYFTRVYSIDPVIAGCKDLDALEPVEPPMPDAKPTPDAKPVPVAKPVPIDKPMLEPETSPKNPDVALELSLGITLGGLALAVGGSSFDSAPMTDTGVLALLVGPSVGHIYAGEGWNGGLGVRLIGGGALGLLGVVVFLGCVDECLHDPSRPTSEKLFIAAGLVEVAGSIYEITTAPSAADRYNREHGFEAKIVPTGNGVAVVGRF